MMTACGDDTSSTKSNDDVADTTADTTSAEGSTSGESFDEVDPASVKVYTSAEVCALVSADVAASTLGVELSGTSPSEMSTPQCSYEFTTADGTFTNLTLAVQRPVDDLGGSAGKAGFDVTTSLVIFDTPYEPLAGLGDLAAISASPSLTLIAVLANDQVFTIATSAPIDLANLVAFGNAVAANV